MLCQLQIETLEREIQDKRKQMRLLEQRLTETSESSMANSSIIEMQQVFSQYYRFEAAFYVNALIMLNHAIVFLCGFVMTDGVKINDPV
jgi:hypothetical protein